MFFREVSGYKETNFYSDPSEEHVTKPGAEIYNGFYSLF